MDHDDVMAGERAAGVLRREARLDAMRELAGSVAHDFNNLLVSIGGYAQLAELSLARGDAAARYLGSIEDSVRRAAEVSRQLLFFARGHSVERSELDVVEVLREALGMVAPTFAKDVSVEVSAEEPLWAVRGDRGALQQAFVNVARNAGDAMVPGGRLVVTLGNRSATVSERASAGKSRAGPFVRVAFTDDGPGIDPALGDRVFEPFVTTRPGRHGLGLSAVYGILRQHDAWATLDAAPGGGATVALYLPAAPPQ